MRFLLDANVLIAWGVQQHPQHQKIIDFVAANNATFLICPVAQGALFRYCLRNGRSVRDTANLCESLSAFRLNEWVPDSIPYENANWDGVRGHKQVTDVYLAELAAANDAKLLTLDEGIVALRPESTFLLA